MGQDINVKRFKAEKGVIGKGRAGDDITQEIAEPARSGRHRRLAVDPRTVFVIHGRDIEARDALFAFLRALRLEPQEWEHLVRATGKGAPSLAEVVDRAVREAQAVVALLTPDDVVRLHPDLRNGSDAAVDREAGCQARPNVYLELGMALAALPDATVILEAGGLRRTTDLAGLNYVTVDSSAEWRNKVAERLHNAGCPVDRGGGDWQQPRWFADLQAYHRRAAKKNGA
ncbi:TIR domain-containing protein [Actinoplanes sp. NPDC020271]|uniref:TIR domain-containing protein n=1 Tax=Actinoplanes sp. NPDC020271 TaxID=3363896 RepID=UPI00379F831C